MKSAKKVGMRMAKAVVGWSAGTCGPGCAWISAFLGMNFDLLCACEPEQNINVHVRGIIKLPYFAPIAKT